MMLSNRLTRSFGLLLIIAFGSCSGPKNTIYFSKASAKDSMISIATTLKPAAIIISPNDIIAINVTSETSLLPRTGKDGTVVITDEVNIYNSGGTQFATVVTSGGSSTSQGQGRAYTVDKSGDINYSIMGKVHVGGLTIAEVNNAIALRLKDYLKNPIVETRILNYKITVLGEVGKPGIVVAPNQTINILEVIAASGDIPISGRKDNVQVIREVDGHREFAFLDLNSREVFNSPYFYLQQNDIVYVEPNKVRRQETNVFTRIYLPVISTLITTGLLVYTITRQ